MCDEMTLNALANDVLATPLHDLLRESLPACMVIIVGTYSQQSRARGEEEGEEPTRPSEEEKKAATNSHNFLTSVLTEEVGCKMVISVK